MENFNVTNTNTPNEIANYVALNPPNSLLPATIPNSNNNPANNIKYQPQLSWIYKEAIALYPQLISEYGPPSFVDPTPNGQVVWKKDALANTIFERIELHDEGVAHCNPIDHYDFLYAFINYEVPPSKVLDVSAVSGGISYDPLKKELRARGGSMKENIVSLALATHVGEGQLTLSYIKANDLYKQWIHDMKDPEKLDQLSDLLAFNIKHQKGNPNPEGYWVMSESGGCSGGVCSV